MKGREMNREIVRLWWRHIEDGQFQAWLAHGCDPATARERARHDTNSVPVKGPIPRWFYARFEQQAPTRIVALARRLR